MGALLKHARIYCLIAQYDPEKEKRNRHILEVQNKALLGEET